MSDDMQMDGDVSAGVSGGAPRQIPASVIVYIQAQDPRTIVLAGKETFGDLRTALIESGIEMDQQVLVDDQDNVKDDSLELDGNVPEAGLAVKTQIALHVVHDNLEWQVPILLNSKQTIGYVKAQLREQDTDKEHFNHTDPSQDYLTWQGVRQLDDQRTDALVDIQDLARADLSEEDRAVRRLYGRKVVSMFDVDIGESNAVQLHEVRDDMLLSEVVQLYQQRERRQWLNLPVVVKYVEGETSSETIVHADPLQLSERVYHLQIENGSTLALKTAMYEVTIKEASAIEEVQQKNKGVGLGQQRNASDDVVGIRVYVFDWWKVKQLKDTYSAVVADGLGANDQLFIDATRVEPNDPVPYADELNEEKTLYQYAITSKSILLVKREDITATYCFYVCADCGNDVKLRNKDAVRCRECGHRIVFKRRIAKPCQYLCR